MVTGLVNGLDSLFIWLSGVLKQNVADYCDLETAQDEFTLVAKDGSLISLVRIDGIKSIISSQTFFNNIVHPFSMALQSPLEKKGHMIQFWFSVDPEKSSSKIREMLTPAYETAKRLELDINQMLDERVSNLANYTAVEDNYLVLWTKPSALVKSELSEEKKRKTKIISQQNTPFKNGQNIFSGISLLQDRHNSFVQSLVDDMGKIGLSVETLSVRTAARCIKKSVDQEFTSNNWEPFLPGDRISAKIVNVNQKREEWDVVWPKLSWQVCARDMTIVSDNMVQIGDLVYAPVYIDLMPKEIKSFDELFGSLINKRDLPWRVSFSIEGDGVSAVSTKSLFASILGFTSGDNKLLNKAVNQLKAMQANNQTIVKIRISLCTWTNINKKDELGRKLSDLARGVESWGSCIVSEVTGDPIAGTLSSALSVTSSSVATTSAAPLVDIVTMLPLTRPCSPWETGAVTFRSPDGKLMPYQPGSSKQTTWVTLIFAKPGSGKSVLMNMTNLALCLAPGLQRLPRIGIVDIGPSSSGLISLIKESLPNGKKHYAEYYRMRMTEEFCVNPFDTQLGCRFPTSEETAFLSNFVSLLVTDPTKEYPPEGTSGLVDMVVHNMYKNAADKFNAKTYDSKVEPKVDSIIEKLGIRIDAKTTWWEIVDELFIQGYNYEALLAQRHAVPILSDATSAAQDEKIKKIYEKIETETKENLIDYFTRNITETLNRYKILARPTVFDIGEARIVALDLDEIAKTGGAIADRQTGVMYLLARYILGKDFKLTVDTVNEMPYPLGLDCPKSVPVDKYRSYHKLKIEETRDDLKRLCFDEFHRTSKSRMVREQIVVDMREGRKWGIDITLASQELKDFDETMRGFATSIFIMDGGNAQQIEEISTIFGIQDAAEKDALQRRIHGPRKGGGTFLAKFSTTNGWYTQLLTSTLGAVELWAFSTTVEDVAIRTRLYKAIGQTKARKLLASVFPGGSAKREIEFRKEQLKNDGVFSDDDSNVYDQMVKELLNKQ